MHLRQQSLVFKLSANVGIGTTNVDDPDLQGIGNSARGLYISNGMILYDNAINGNHYIGTSMNGLMAGPVSVMVFWMLMVILCV